MNTPTSDCQRARHALSAQLDAQATESEIGSALRHVRGCQACAGFAAAAAELTERLRSAEVLEPARQLAPTRLPVRRARRRAVVRRSLAATAMAASLAAAALLGAAVSAQNHSSAPAHNRRPVLLLASARDESALRTLELSRYAPALDLGGSRGARPTGGVFEASDIG
jgi:predicted anti-sigma-YlaC factor YlaD